VLLGARWYRPALGRFLTPDRWLMVEQTRIPGIIGTANLYALDNPANYTDPSGRPAFLIILVVAAVVGAVLGAIGAASTHLDLGRVPAGTRRWTRTWACAGSRSRSTGATPPRSRPRRRGSSRSPSSRS
jgi:hypothetical protein